jgi:NurA-like 5'-3' nuclease
MVFICSKQDAVIKVVEHADSLQTKLEAYDIQRSIALTEFAPNDLKQLLDTMIELLQSLGENIPREVDREEITKQIGLVIAGFGRESDHNLLHLFTDTSKDYAAIMQGYNM